MDMHESRGGPIVFAPSAQFEKSSSLDMYDLGGKIFSPDPKGGYFIALASRVGPEFFAECKRGARKN